MGIGIGIFSDFYISLISSYVKFTLISDKQQSSMLNTQYPVPFSGGKTCR